MIDVDREQLVSLTRAKIPGNPSAATRWRWAYHGVKGGVKIEIIRIGGLTYTTQEAVARFLQACNASCAGAVLTLPPEPTAAARKACEKLRKMGC